MTLISIVLAYNTKVELTIECLNHLKRLIEDEKDYNYEVVLVNGGNVVDINHDVVSKYIKLTANFGFTKVLNEGLKNVSNTSDYILFTSNDCFIQGQKPFRQLIQDNQNHPIVSVLPDNPPLTAYNHLLIKEDEDGYYCDFFPTITWFFKRQFLEEVGYLDENFRGTGMYADNDWARRAVEKYGTTPIFISKKVPLHHKCGSESNSVGTVHVDMSEGGRYFQEKWRKK